MDIVIFFFSGTGNTWWASQELKNELEKLGGAVEILSLENPSLQEEGFLLNKIREAKHIIVGYPVYGSDMPRNIKEFVYSLPIVSDNKRFSAFCTQAGFSGDGTVFFKKDIEERGYTFRQSFQIDMTTNFNVAMLPFSLSKPAMGKKLEKIKIKASAKIKKMASLITGDKEHIEGERFYQVLLGGLQRSFFRRSEKKFAGNFKFSKDRCIKCNICCDTCPTGNIILGLEPLDLKRKDNCLLCFRCYNFCPSLAINYGKATKNPEKYIRYKGPIDKIKMSEIREHYNFPDN